MQMKSTLRILCFTLGLYFGSASAQVTISGKVIDTSGNPVGQALIEVSNTCKSGKITFTTDSSGNFNLSSPDCDTITIICMVSGVENQPLTLSKISDNFNDVIIRIQQKTSQIQAATIQAKSPTVLVQGDKTIIDAVKLNPGAVASALDLLIRCPGVMVDEYNNSISLKGKPGTLIMIESRLQPLTGENLFTWLRNTPAATISFIELIPNPSARYDASGNAGFINIRFKKNTAEGTSGNITGGAGQGRYGKLSAGSILNYKKNKTQLSSQYNYALRRSFNQLYLQRNFYNNDTLTGSFDQRNYLRFPIQVHVLRFGIDQRLSTSWSTGASISGNFTRFDPNGKNYSTVLGSDGQVLSYFSTVNNSKDNNSNVAANAYIRKNIDSLGSSFSTDFDAAVYGNKSRQSFLTEYFNSNYQKNVNDYLLTGKTDGLLNILAIKSDYVKKTSTGNTIELGAKGSRVQADNNVRFFDASSGTSLLDSNKSNHFVYTENIIAAYAQWAGGTQQWQYQLGLRNESTIAKGIQKTTGQGFNKSYSQWFPSVVLNRITAIGNMWSLSLVRRIQRPSYNDLNPFKFYLDPSTYKAGNVNLNPENTWSAELGFASAKGKAISISANRVQGIITEILYPSENEPRTTVQTSVNLSSCRTLVATVSLPTPLGKKSTGYWSLSAAHQTFFGNIASTQLNKSSIAVTLNGNQSFVLNKYWQADLSATYQSGQVYGYMYLKQLGQLGMGVQRSLWNKTAIVKLNISDIFFTGSPVGESNFEGYSEQFQVWRETRVAMMSFVWKFGNPQQGTKRRSGSAEDEKQRAQNAIG